MPIQRIVDARPFELTTPGRATAEAYFMKRDGGDLVSRWALVAMAQQILRLHSSRADVNPALLNAVIAGLYLADPVEHTSEGESLITLKVALETVHRHLPPDSEPMEDAGLEMMFSGIALLGNDKMGEMLDAVALRHYRALRDAAAPAR